MGSVNSVVPVYFDWRTRKFTSIGSTNAATTVTAESVVVPQLADINPSSSIEWTLWPTVSNNAPQDVGDIGFFWWDAENARYVRTDTLEGYTSGLENNLLNQGWQVDANAFNLSNIGRANVQSLQYYDGSQSTPYAFQGDYRALAETLILDADEWQALFAGGGDVELPGLGLIVEQYATGVTVVEAADGTFTVTSNAAGGIANIRPIGDVRQVFGTLGDLTLDDSAIFEASQREISPLFGLLETDEESSPVGVGGVPVRPDPQTETNNDFKNPADTVQRNAGVLGDPSATVGTTRAAQVGAAAPLIEASRDPIQILDTPIDSLNDGLDESATQSEPSALVGSVQAQDQALNVILSSVYQDTTEVALQRLPYLRQNEGFSITDDPSSESDDRKRDRQTYLSFSDKKQAQDDMLKREAASSNSNVRRLRAMQLRSYFDL